jgi:ankyrin repeat protein
VTLSAVDPLAGAVVAAIGGGDGADLLIAAGVDVVAPGGCIGTPLDTAVAFGCGHVARNLVAAGADLNFVPEFSDERSTLNAAGALDTQRENLVEWLEAKRLSRPPSDVFGRLPARSSRTRTCYSFQRTRP